MKVFMNFITKLNDLKSRHPRLAFAGQVFGYYALMMILYLYFMLANLSSAPKFVYTQF